MTRPERIPASDFTAPPPPTFPAWVRYASLVPLYGIAWPLIKALELCGVWPRAMSGGAARHMPDFGDYRPTSQDVIVCAGFKSGTTWLLNIATQIAFRGRAEFANIHHAVPWPDMPNPLLAKRIIPLADPSPLARSPTGLRVIKTHLERERVPFVPEAHYIALTRDPKDCCVSSYHFVKSMALGPLMPSVDRWIDVLCSSDFPGAWPKQVAGYWAVRDAPNVLFLTYEDMKRDRRAAVETVARFMNVALDSDELDDVLYETSFETMRQAAAKFDPGRILPWGEERYMVRSGRSGNSAELLSPGQQRRIDEWCRSELKRLGSDFPYERYDRAAR
jgi:hypothetical protein